MGAQEAPTTTSPSRRRQRWRSSRRRRTVRLRLTRPCPKRRRLPWSLKKTGRRSAGSCRRSWPTPAEVAPPLAVEGLCRAGLARDAGGGRRLRQQRACARGPDSDARAAQLGLAWAGAVCGLQVDSFATSPASPVSARSAPALARAVTPSRHSEGAAQKRVGGGAGAHQAGCTAGGCQRAPFGLVLSWAPHLPGAFATALKRVDNKARTRRRRRVEGWHLVYPVRAGSGGWLAHRTVCREHRRVFDRRKSRALIIEKKTAGRGRRRALPQPSLISRSHGRRALLCGLLQRVRAGARGRRATRL